MPAIGIICPHCDASLKVEDTTGGKRIRCPKCKQPFTVSVREDGRATVAPRPTALKAKPAARVVEDAGDDNPDDNARRQRSKKQQTNPLLLWGLIGGGAGVLLLGGIVVAVIVMITNSSKGSSASIGQRSSERQPLASSSDSGSRQSKGSSPGNSSSDNVMEIKAQDLAEELQALDEKAFDRKYRTATLVVSGTMEQLMTTFEEDFHYVSIYLKTEVSKRETSFSCSFSGRDIAEAKKVPIGASVRISGKIFISTSKANGVMLDNCHILSWEPPGPPPAEKSMEVRAGDWARELQNDEGAWKKYQKVSLIVEGTVEASHDNRSSFTLHLAGYDKTLRGQVHCLFEGDAMAEAKKIGQGSVVRIKGKLSPIVGKSNGALIDECRIVSGGSGSSSAASGSSRSSPP